MSMNKVTFDIKVLEKLQRTLGTHYVAQVGVLGSKAAQNRGGINNASLGAVHEFGSLSRNIPARSFIMMPLREKLSTVMKKKNDFLKDALFKGDVKLFFKRIGIMAETVIQDAFSTGGFGKWAPLKPATIRARIKKGDNVISILVELGDLKRSVTSRAKNKTAS